eukprot:1155779-Rhodomonas_salina.2
MEAVMPIAVEAERGAEDTHGCHGRLESIEGRRLHEVDFVLLRRDDEARSDHCVQGPKLEGPVGVLTGGQ